MAAFHVIRKRQRTRAWANYIAYDMPELKWAWTLSSLNVTGNKPCPGRLSGLLLCAKLQAKFHAHIISLNPHSNSKTLVLLLPPYLMDEKTMTQRSQVTLPRVHDKWEKSNQAMWLQSLKLHPSPLTHRKSLGSWSITIHMLAYITNNFRRTSFSDQI